MSDSDALMMPAIFARWHFLSGEAAGKVNQFH